MIKIILLIIVIFCTSCVKTTTDYFFNDSAIIFSNKSKFGYNPEKIYILKKDLQIFNSYDRGAYFPNNWEISGDFGVKIGMIKKGARFKASRVRRESTYLMFIPFLPAFQSIYNHLEVLDGSFEGSEISVDSISIISEDSQPFHDTYKDISPNYQLFEEIDDLEDIKLKLYDVPTINNY